MKKWIVLFLALLQILLLVGCVGTQGGNALYADMPTAPQTNAQLRVYCLGNVGGGKSDFGGAEPLSAAVSRCGGGADSADRGFN